MDLSIVIVSYNTRELLAGCIASVKETAQSLNYEIFVVDNASVDGSPDELEKTFPEVTLIRNQDNRGFARACNQGLRQSSGNYALLLNSDTIVLPGCLEKMVRFMDEHPKCGGATCKELSPEGAMVPASTDVTNPKSILLEWTRLARLFSPSKYVTRGRDYDQTWQIHFIGGSFFMVRKEILTTVGLLDENFFFNYEDDDWSIRIEKAGWELYYYPEAKMIHHWGASPKKLWTPELYKKSSAGYFYFIGKHYGKAWQLIIRLISKPGEIRRALVRMLKRNKTEPAS